MLLPLLLATAQAGDLTYAWPEGETLHYRIQGYVKAPRLLRFYKSENEDARLGEFTFGLMFDCVVGKKKKKTVELACDVHKAELAGIGFASEQEKLDMIFAEYKGLLEDSATVEMVFTHEGRLKTVDLEGLDTSKRRTAGIAEDLRQTMARAFSTLEVELPKDGATPEGVWKQKGSPRIFDLPSAQQGTVGAKDYFHDVVGNEDGVLMIRHSGEGTVAEGSSMDGGTAEGSYSYTGKAHTISMFVAGFSTFDTERGLLLSTELRAQGMETASSSTLMQSGELYVDTFLMADLVESWESLEAPEPEPEPAAEPALDEAPERKEAPADEAAPVDSTAPEGEAPAEEADEPSAEEAEQVVPERKDAPTEDAPSEE